MKRADAKKYLLSLAVPLVFLVSVLLLFGFRYDVNDDPTMECILNGSYSGTPDGHAIFLRYPLALPISLLYRLLPAVRWYPGVLLGCMLFAMAFLLCQLLDRFPKHPLLVSALFFGSVSFIWIRPVAVFTFSTCGAFVSAAAALSYALIPKEEDRRPGKLIPVVLLLCLSYCIRDYFALVSLLFLGIVWLYKYHDRMFKEARCWLIPAVGILAMLLCVGCDKLAYSSPEWSAYKTYNDERSYLMDYVGVPDYKEYPELYDALGYDARQAACLKNYTYALLEGDPQEAIHELYLAVRVAEANAPSPSLLRTVKRTVKDTLTAYFPSSLKDIGPLTVASILCPFALVLAAVILSIRDRRHHWPFPLLLMAALACLWLYICYNGRTPVRVMLSIRLFCVSASLIGFAILADLHAAAAPAESGGKRLKKEASLPRAVSVLLICLSAAAVFFGVRYAKSAVGLRQESKPAPYSVYAGEHPENIYLYLATGSWSKHPYRPFNTLPTGSWLHYSPLYWEKVRQLGLEDGINQSVLLRPDVYLILQEDRDVRKTLGLSTDVPLEYEVVDQLEGSYVVYQFSVIGE